MVVYDVAVRGERVRCDKVEVWDCWSFRKEFPKACLGRCILPCGPAGERALSLGGWVVLQLSEEWPYR